jgi:fructose-1,6-bisphosphatase/sedoheptulose 1,7-bisphosphatase-like protein
VQRRALGVLFCVIATALVGTAVAALVGAGSEPRGWIVAAAALALAGWIGSVGVSALRR